MQPKLKAEVVAEAELARTETERALKDAGEVWSGNNAVASVWRASKETFRVSQEKVLATSHAADQKIRSNIYTSLGIAVGLGALVRHLLARKPRKTRNRRKR